MCVEIRPQKCCIAKNTILVEIGLCINATGRHHIRVNVALELISHTHTDHRHPHRHTSIQKNKQPSERAHSITILSLLPLLKLLTACPRLPTTAMPIW